MSSTLRMGARATQWTILSATILLVTILLYYASWKLPATFQYRIDSSRGHVNFKAPKRNVWAELSASEAADVHTFFLGEFEHLNFTTRPKSARENSILSIETLRPNKTCTVPYLYEAGVVPERWAKVAISQILDDDPYVAYYMVGPLPISSDTQVRPLNYIFTSGKNHVINPVQNFVALIDYALDVGESIADITEDLLGAKVNKNNPNDPEALQVFPRPTPLEAVKGGLTIWIQFYRPGRGSGGRSLLPQGLYVKVDASSMNMINWKVNDFYYNGILYRNENSLRDALGDAKFIRIPPNVDGSWTDTEDFDSMPEGRELPPPVTIQPFGPRYKLDREEQFVSWFGWSFYISTGQATGLSLFDLRFKGERVMYEVGLQEALSHYAGDDPTQGGLEFLDTFFGMGKKAFELVPGYDCPAYADYLDVEYHEFSKTQRIPNSICIFEFTADHLLSRHSAQYSVTVARNTFLTVRYVSTVGNYDYEFSYIFYLDGAVEVKVRASGYIFAAFHSTRGNKTDNEYGHRIHDALASSMHDHVINFRADLDVAGQPNEMVRMAVEPTTKSYPWDQPEIPERNTMHLVEYPVTTEIGLDWPKNSGEFYIVRSTQEKNAWGQNRGYRVTSGTGMGNPPHLTIRNSTMLGDTARWAEHDLWVLRRKDTEPKSADPLNYFATHEPLIDFNKHANNESIDKDTFDGDLVIYFNLGAHHVPHSGDIPNTLMHTSASSVMFVPHNFCDRDPSRESVQGVRLQMKGHTSGGYAGEDLQEPNGDLRSRNGQRSATTNTKRRTKAKYFGRTYEDGLQVPLESLEPDLLGYVSTENAVTDLSFNGSAAGAWYREDD